MTTRSARKVRRLPPALAGLFLLAFFPLLSPATATSKGEIVIHGAQASSHLRITVSEGNILVDGTLARGSQVGCRRGGHVCPISGAGRMEIIMGPNSDKVEVLDPLPMPLTVHLGAGSNKFIGNSEPDTCYPEGAIANGCVGRGGNDRCIVLGGNSECFGGPGNDYCKGGSGSDGCWGGPGNDVCYMGPGEDGCHGGPGNDRLYGGPGADRLYGGPGIDYCNGGPGRGRSQGCELGPGH